MRTAAGVRAEAGLTLWGRDARVSGLLGWRHIFGDVDLESTAHFRDGTEDFTISGAPLARDAATIGAGIDIAVSGQSRPGISYTGEVGPDSQSHGAQLSFTLKF